MTPDAKYFRANPEGNYRVRLPYPGEVDEIGRAMLPDGVEWPGILPPPSPETPWRVLVVKLPGGRNTARMLTLAAPGDEPEAAFTHITFLTGARLPIA